MERKEKGKKIRILKWRGKRKDNGRERKTEKKMKVLRKKREKQN